MSFPEQPNRRQDSEHEIDNHHQLIMTTTFNSYFISNNFHKIYTQPSKQDLLIITDVALHFKYTEGLRARKEL